jgi:Protein of unknown function (DUF2490)
MLGLQHYIHSGALVALSASVLHAQTVDPVPASLEDIAAQWVLPAEFSFEQQIQSGTQGSSRSGNPFAYRHGVQIRSWLHYDGIRNATLTGGVSYIDYFSVPGTSNYNHPEWRVTAYGTLKQPLPGGSLYEQVRFELLNFRDSQQVSQHLPRVRFRFGQNLDLGEGESKPYLGVYEEAIVQFPKASYSHVNFEGARFFAGYGFRWGTRCNILLGFKAEGDVSSTGSKVTLYYGPVFSIDYNFRRDRELNKTHQRTTAFKDF